MTESGKLKADTGVVVWEHPHLSLMADDILLPFEGLQAGVAGEKPLGAVHMLFVDLQVAAVSKGLLAGLAAIHDVSFDSMVRAWRERITGRWAVVRQDHKSYLCLADHQNLVLQHIKPLEEE